MYKIGEFSKISGLSINTLRHYESIGILEAEYTDRFTGYRYYSAQQLVTVNKILVLKDAGFSLDEILRIFSDDLSDKNILTLLQKKADVLEVFLLDEEERLRRMKKNIFNIKNGGVPLMNEVVIKKVEPILTASVRKVITKADFDAEMQMWAEVNSHISSCKVQAATPCMSLYYNETWDFDKTEYWDVAVAEALTKPIPETGNVKVGELPYVEKMASVIHKGSLRNISEAYRKIEKWAEDNNYKVSEPVREIYHVGEWNASSKDDYITEIQFPLVIE